MAHALCQVLEHGGSLQSFYVGVPGAGALDALFLMPLVMAAVIAYAGARLRGSGELLQAI